MNFKINLSILLIAFLCILNMPQKAFSQACVGSSVTLTIQAATQTGPNKFTFEIWAQNTGSTTLRLSAFAGNVQLSTGSPLTLGSGYNMITLEQPLLGATGLNTITPNMNSLTAIRWTNNPNQNSNYMLVSSVMLVKFELTLGTGGIMPPNLQFQYISPSAVTSYCNGNANSNTMNTSTLGLLFGAAAPLPIKISTLDAFKSGNNNLIKWTTESEVNNEYQIVETSLDGFSGWSEVGKVNSRNAANGASYQVIDRKPSRLNYYRIHSIDFDGREEFSHVVSVQRDKGRSNIVSVYPNPTVQLLNVDLSGVDMALGNLEILLFDATAQKVLGQKSKSNFESIDMTALPAGIYNLIIRQAEETLHQERVIKIE